MNHTNPRIERLKEMLNLEAQREQLQRQLDSLVEKIVDLKDSLFDDEASVTAAPSRKNGVTAAAAKTVSTAKAAPAPKLKAPKAPARTSGRAPRGSLKDQIFAALEAAGAAGVYVTELSKALNTKPANIHAWFHAGVKRYPQIQKVEGGHYRLSGKAPASSKSEASVSPAKVKPVAAASKTASGRAPRGELSSRMLSALEDAGAKGTTVSELSDKLGVPYKNVSIWFATTGKKNRKIKKIGKAQYKLA